MIKKIDHIAIAVKDLDAEIRRYRDVLGLEYLGSEVVESQGVKLAFFRAGDVKIELTTPITEESPIAGFLAKHGGGIHHLAFEVSDIRRQISDLQDRDIRMIHTTPKAGAGGSEIAFAHPKSFSGVLLEFKEKQE